MEDVQNLLNEIEAGVASGLISSEEATQLSKDLQNMIEVADASNNIVLKGKILTTLSVLSKVI